MGRSAHILGFAYPDTIVDHNYVSHVYDVRVLLHRFEIFVFQQRNPRAAEKRQKLNLQPYKLDDGTTVRLSTKEIRNLKKEDKNLNKGKKAA